MSWILCAKLCREKDDIYYMYKKKKRVFLERGGCGHVCDIFFCSLFLLPLSSPSGGTQKWISTNMDGSGIVEGIHDGGGVEEGIGFDFSS